MNKMIVGIHDKFCSMRAVEYVMKLYKERQDIEVTLVNVFPKLPAVFWDEGHILSPDEEKTRQKVIDIWSGKQKDYIEPILQSAVYDMVRQGFPKERVHTRFVLGTSDVADCLIDEAKRLDCKTIVIGRCGLAEGRHFVAGTVVSKLINHAVGLAVCIVQ